jgi:predicted secreted protein
MSGEVNATNVILQNGTGAIVGQMEMTLTYNGTPIDISNKSAGDFVQLLDGELAGKQLQMSGTLVYNDDTQYRKVRADSLVGTQDAYTVTYTSDATTDEAFSASMVPNGLSDALPHGDKISTTLTFLSSGTVTHTAAA